MEYTLQLKLIFYKSMYWCSFFWNNHNL